LSSELWQIALEMPGSPSLALTTFALAGDDS